MLRFRSLPALAPLALTGCFVFDPSLYMNVDAGPDGGSSPLQGELAEVCGDEAPLLALGGQARSYTFAIDTRGRVDSERDVSRCTGRIESGPDLFLAIDARRGERWHFHARVDPTVGGANPAIYVLRNCDARACRDGDGLDVCGPGADEHFSFVPDEDARYVVAFDSPDADGFAGMVEAYRTECGDGTQEHGENCDDGNDVDDDECDNACRRVLTGSSPLEREVNDDAYSANALHLPASGTMSVRGEIDGLCEVDVFAIDVPEGGSITAALRAEGGGECPPAAAGVVLELLELVDLGEPRVRVAGTVPSGAVCPEIAADAALAQNLPAGTYYLRVSKVQERPDEFRYQLDVTLTP
ncbi:MAG TPA: hypothetical protein VIL20_28735 [Sandaracinaceae bacterium]